MDKSLLEILKKEQMQIKNIRSLTKDIEEFSKLIGAKGWNKKYLENIIHERNLELEKARKSLAHAREEMKEYFEFIINFEVTD